MITHYRDEEHVDFMEGVFDPGDTDRKGHRHPDDPDYIPWDASLEQLLFNTVYEWGRNGVQVDSTAPFYQALIKEITKMGMRVHDK